MKNKTRTAVEWMFIGAFAAIVLTSSARAAAPAVNWLRPTNGSTFAAGSIVLRASVADLDSPIGTIEFYDGETVLRRLSGFLTNGTYNFTWSNAPAGNHQLRAEAEDITGERGVSPSVEITVTNAPPPNLVPVVNMFTPTNGALIASGDPILLTAGATDPDGTVSYLEFFSGVQTLGRATASSTNGTYGWMWTNAAPGMYVLHAEAVDNSGGRGISATVQVNLTGITNPPTSNALPVVTITQPSHGAAFNRGVPILVRASVSDAEGTLTNLDFLDGSSLLRRFSGTMTNGTYNFNWSNAPSGAHLLRVQARDASGAIGTSAPVSITVVGTNLPPTNNVIPAIAFLQPTNGAIYPAGSSILLRASASDADGSLTNIDFLDGATVVHRFSGALTNGIYNFIWVGAGSGAHLLRALARDNAGALGTSAPVNITVTGTNQQPTTCTYVLSPPNTTLNAAGGTGVVSVVTQPGCSWETFSSNAWIHVQPPSLHVGSDSVLYLVDANPGATRTGRLHIDGHSFDVTQLGATTNMPPSSNAWPVVTWFFPADGASFAAGNPVLLRAIASDSDSGLSIVDFLEGTNLLGRVPATTNGTYSFLWTNAPAGIHQVHAEAVDEIGERGASASVQIVIGDLGLVDLGTVQVSTIGHLMGGASNGVVNFLVDQDQSSGGGGVLEELSINWDTNSQFKLTVAAPPGMKFSVNVPAGKVARFNGFLWWESSRGGFSAPGNVVASFTDVEGVAPTFSGSDSALSDSHGFFGFSEVQSSGITNSFAFTSLTLIGTVVPEPTGHGTESYTPHLESFLQIQYPAAGPDDSESFVALVPAHPRPLIEMVNGAPASGVLLRISGRPGITHVVECSTDTVDWIPISSEVMPASGSHVVRDYNDPTVESRFYRVVERP